MDDTRMLVPALSADLFGDAARLASTLDPALVADRDGAIERIRADLEAMRLGGLSYRLGLMKLAAVALLAVEAWDRTNLPQPAPRRAAPAGTTHYHCTGCDARAARLADLVHAPTCVTALSSGSAVPQPLGDPVDRLTATARPAVGREPVG